MLALLSHLETPASHWFRWLKLKSKDMLALTSLKTLGQTVSCNSNDYQSNTYITISFLVKNDVYMCLFLTYLKVQISQDALGKCAFHFVI